MTSKNISIKIPALKRPTLIEIQKDHSWIKSIERDTSPTEGVTLIMSSVLKDGETRISDTEYEKRLSDSTSSKTTLNFLGWQHRKWLLDHQEEFSELEELLGKNCIMFGGLFVIGGDDVRVIPCIYDDGERWRGYWYWLAGGFNSKGLIALSAEAQMSNMEEKSRHVDGQCTSSCRRVGCPEEETIQEE